MLEAWVEEAAGQPLFVWLHLFDAHAPYEPPREFDRRYYPRGEGDPYDKDREIDMPQVDSPAYLKGLRDKQFPYQQYRAEVDYVDQLIGRVLEIDRFKDGIVAFTADHGESFGEHGIWWDHADLYPQTVHVPLILSWPGGPQAELCDEPVSHLDLGRTLLDLSELEDMEFPGRNLQWALEETPEPLPLFRIAAHGFSAAVQTGDWYLILHLRWHKEWALEQERLAHSVELYNLRSDPECVDDLVREEEHFERAKRMRSRLVEWLQSAPATGLGSNKVMSDQELENLKSLGYLGEDDAPEGPLYVEDPTSEWVRFFAR
jgi:arylsulfatase A-like enzyme